jgi:hypothetical protein
VISRLHITVYLFIAISTWTLFLFLSGVNLTSGHFAPFFSVVGVLAMFAYLFEVWIWRWKILQGWFVSRPNISGTWKGTLHSNWIDPSTGSPPPLSTCYLGVKQTFSTLHVQLMTSKSESHYISERLQKVPAENRYQLAGIYLNHPNIHIRGKGSEIHRGAILINVSNSFDSNFEGMTGEYWTDRETSGSINFTVRSSKLFSSYDAAHTEFRISAN